MPFGGADIGGFGESPTPELFTRWLQAGVFSPFMRIHTAIGTADQEPWSYGAAHEGFNRRAIELRYELLPHIYNQMQQASATGVPALRPVFLEFPADSRTWAMDDQFMFGPDLLVAPVLLEAQTERELYLPAGTWFDFWTGPAYKGGETTRVPVTLASIPIFVRGGAFVFRQPVVQHTGEMSGQTLRVDVFPAAWSQASLYEDDGLSFEYQRGRYMRRSFTQARTVGASPGADEAVTIEIGAAEGSYRPKDRLFELRVRWDGPVRSVTLRAAPGSPPTPLGGYGAAELEKRAAGWTITNDGFVLVKMADGWDGMTITIER
jgi:alpha-glucosidase